MTSDKFLQMKSGDISSRRDFSRLLGSVGLVMMLVPGWSKSASAAEDAVYYSLGGYSDKSLFEAYKKINGSEPSINLYSDEEEALTKLRSGYTPDVSYCGTYSVARWRDAGVVQPIDVSRVTHWADLFESLKVLPDVVANGQQWAVPLGWGTTSVLYRTDLVQIAEESWGLLWDDRYKGRLAMIDNVADGVAAAAIYAGINPYDMDDAAIAKVKEVMSKQRPLLRMYTTDMTSLQQAIASGEVVAAETWNDAYAALRRQGVAVNYMFHPKEGISTWATVVVLNKNAPHIDKAYDVINSLTGPEAATFWISKYGFGHSNEKSYAGLSNDQLNAAGLPRDPKPVLAGGILQSRMKNEAKISKMLEEVKAGI